jgi:FlaA1/EpsC-like NDP-sugar epimerase
MADVVNQNLLDEIASGHIARRGTRGAISHEVLCELVQVLDFLAVVLAGGIAFAFYLIVVIGDWEGYDRYGLTVLLAAMVFVAALRRGSTYTISRLSRFGWQISRAVLLWGATLGLLSTISFFAKIADLYSRGWVLTWALLVISELVLLRAGLRSLMQRWGAQGRLSRAVAIVGAGDGGEQLIAKLRTDGRGEIAIAGVFDDRLNRVPAYVGGCRVLGTTDDLIAMTRSGLIDEIIIALPLRAEGRIGELVAKLRSLPVDLRLSIDQIGGFPMRGIGETA